jgi:ABC-type transporter Mla subunit MlaD
MEEFLQRIFQPQILLSAVVSIVMSVLFIRWQYREYTANVNAIGRLKRFFSKKEDYSTYESSDYSNQLRKYVNNVKIKDVANDDTELKNLIEDINQYIGKSKGTVAFSIIQNKTERRISMLYEIATSKIAFPTQIGLMGTFAGVFVGLIMFLGGTFVTGEINDTSIQSLIFGVLVSMITSCCGLYFLIDSHKLASEASNQVDKDKNDFYEWVQNELMPSVDVSMVEAIGKLHETIDQFEPTFSRVINQFKDAFSTVTSAFGSDFKKSVEIVSSAVDTMGRNMDKVNENIDVQEKLLSTIKSNELIHGMEAFVAASQKFSEITGSLDQFERARRLMLIAAQESINLQKDFNESLQIPKQVAAEINSILDRITTFENNINGLGVSIAQTQLVGNETVNEIKETLSAIKAKQKVAKEYANTANSKLAAYFESHQHELGQIAKKYNEALESYLSDYEKMLQERKEDLEQRKREFTEAIDQKFSLEDIRSEFTNLKKLNDILKKITILDGISADDKKIERTLEDIRRELTVLNSSQEEKKKGFLGFGGGSSASVDRALREKEKAEQEARQAKEDAAAARAHEEAVKRLNEQLRKEAERDRIAQQKIEEVMRSSETSTTPVKEEPSSEPTVISNDAPDKDNKPSFFRRLFGRK